ncbi:MAG: HI0074 family nucleotidyltransferase substrate-binding subunit [Candidatus Ratteibacteria bacterium]|nr:HI0074 family nucleotidyltransferase substrate-binding subunit [Candidatus Ratteibacteria bacterium]
MASNIEVQSLFEQFKAAYGRLKEAINIKEGSDIKRDAVIKRFEFTYELLWKTYKKIARLQKLDYFNPKACFQFAFKSGLIEDEELFLEIIDARNKTTHVYSEEEAKKIYDFIKAKAISAFGLAERKIKEMNE